MNVERAKRACRRADMTLVLAGEREKTITGATAAQITRNKKGTPVLKSRHAAGVKARDSGKLKLFGSLEREVEQALKERPGKERPGKRRHTVRNPKTGRFIPQPR